MSIGTFLENLLIGPLKLIFEIIFSLANRYIGHPGLAIIFLSLIMNILVLPLYRRADAMQEAARDIDLKLRKGVSHIKNTFSGDEQMMILQTYYRQNNYKPTDALNGSVSLLLEIPFFMAAYQFLSHLEILNGVPFGPIADMGAPDGLLVIGNITINLLPVLMTLINVISSAIYLKGFPLKTKIQLYGMAAFFLVFLYTSPACLVFYWTLNNLFSLVKTIFYKIKNPQKVLRCLLAFIGCFASIYAVLFYTSGSMKLRVALILFGICLMLPLLSHVLNLKKLFPNSISLPSPNKKLFVWGSIFLTLLVGLVIPSTYIAASPQEYVDLTYFEHPLWYIVSTATLSAGTFLIWLRVFYWLADTKWKVIFERLVWGLCGVMFVNYTFFGTNLGIISSSLQYENGMFFTVSEQIINLLLIAGIAVLLYLIAVKWSKLVVTVLLTASIALTALSGMNIVTIKKSVDQISTAQASEVPGFTLSTSGQNVVVIMLDRALGETLPFIFAERPELQEKFAGFTFYDNTISYGRFTNFGTPSLFGGYEYTPVELNKRDQESLAAKQNEALKVMPLIFSQNGFDVTVCDPVYANYQWIPDLSIFDEYPEIQTYNTEGFFDDISSKAQRVTNTHRNFFCFSVMKCLPVFMQPVIYNTGTYNQAQQTSSDTVVSTTQTTQSLSVAEGINSHFMESYNVLINLPSITAITNQKTNTYVSMVNSITHEPMLLQEPEYIPSAHVDNTQYDKEHADRFVLGNKQLLVDTEYKMIHYHANMAAMIQVGNWLDYLRSNDVYDNTRIILVSDHGNGMGQLQELIHDDGNDVSAFYPLLMMKDFYCDTFSTSHDFMTNADVPVLAMQGLIENPINPFTKEPINNDAKYAHDQYIILSQIWDTAENNGNTFLPSQWASVKNDLWDESNWTFYSEETVLSDHSAP